MSSDLERLRGDALFLAGPTASGKTGLALAVAERLAEHGGGEIVNADSMQVFADLRILSARPSDAETARAPHHLFGHVDADEHYSVGRWLSEAMTALEDIARRGATAIVVGGSGLYFKALTDGLADAPDPGPEARAAALAILEREGVEGLRGKAEALDPEGAAALAPGDRHRLLRLVAYALAHGAPLSEARAQTAPPRLAMRWRALVLEPDRTELYRRIDARAAAMLDQGAIEEALRLEARGLAADRPALKALGVHVLAQLGRGEIAREVALETLARDTRRYAKRQLTWFRNQTADWPRIAAPDLDAAIETWCGQSPK
ncbi:MAG: tRNA (adenosine(37)-N6)-dimethylallyltransferase MiaA [Maricaulaceae bacterium]|jgi:tRNA dimethylallyltransferase